MAPKAPVVTTIAPVALTAAPVAPTKSGSAVVEMVAGLIALGIACIVSF
jgi:hypothetical protein